MIVRPLEPMPRATDDFLPAWQAVMQIQKQQYRECWMITQPSHAALAGAIAARLRGPQVPRLEPELLQAISLHDAGWGMPDAQAVMRSRSAASDRPKSFLEMSVSEFLAAWKQSIEIAQAGSFSGGYMVSRHFWRLAMHWLKMSNGVEADCSRMQSFVDDESRRQRTLAQEQDRRMEELEALTDLLQFCDLFSLYICSGALANAEFPEYFGMKARLTVEGGDYRLEPALAESGPPFKIAALRHPCTKETSGREIEIRIA